MTNNITRESYLGDGVYIKWDGQYFTLYTSNGIATTNEIVLEIDVWLALTRFVKSLEDERR